MASKAILEALAVPASKVQSEMLDLEVHPEILANAPLTAIKRWPKPMRCTTTAFRATRKAHRRWKRRKRTKRHFYEIKLQTFRYDWKLMKVYYSTRLGLNWIPRSETSVVRNRLKVIYLVDCLLQQLSNYEKIEDKLNWTAINESWDIIHFIWFRFQQR